jgi:hypothetical protein
MGERLAARDREAEIVERGAGGRFQTLGHLSLTLARGYE